MICSLQELVLKGNSFQKNMQKVSSSSQMMLKLVADALEILNLNDEVLELGLTPNRADCLNMLGVAYEVAAILRQ